MNQDEALRLLIADQSRNDAEEFISLLRNAGHAVRATHVEDAEDLHEALADKPFDLFLCSAQLESLGLDLAIKQISKSGKDLPLIALADTDSSDVRLQVMQQGARDLVCKEMPDHLKLVIAREFANLRERRRLKQLETALHETEKRCNSLLDSSRTAIAYVHEGMHIYANQAYMERFGYDDFDEIEGMPLLDMIVPDDQPTVKNLLRRLDRGDHSLRELDLTMLCDEGPMEVSMDFSEATIDGEPCTQILIRSRSDSHQLAQQLETISKQDPVTGLFNRTHFQELLEAAMAEKSDEQDTTIDGLLYIQVDRPDSILLSIGPSGSDKVMGDLAGLVRAELDDSCIAARFADDVITVLLPNRGVHESVAVAEAVRGKLEDHIVEARGRTVTPTCSIGVLQIEKRPADINQTLTGVLMACEAARHAGGNQVHVHSADKDEGETDETRVWAKRLKSAMEDDRFFLVYMPVANLSGDSIIRYEARVRMRGDDGTVHTPAEFIGPAEECKLMPQLDRWVVTHALDSIDRKQLKHFLMFVKLSGPTLADPEFLPFLGKLLEEKRIPGKCLTFQINEPVATTQLNDARKLFRGLKELGCGFSLDHFGSGLNPFKLLKHLPADYLKLDRSLMQALPDSEEAGERMQEIIENAHNMKKQVIAGYLEDAGTLARMWQFQVDFVQGNFLQPPSGRMDYDFSGMMV